MSGGNIVRKIKKCVKFVSMVGTDVYEGYQDDDFYGVLSIIPISRIVLIILKVHFQNSWSQ